MADLYRKSAIEKLSSVDRTDRTMAITRPLSWLALVGIAIIVAATAIWAFWGTIPITVSGKGIVTSPTGSNQTVICYISLADAKRLKQGMEVRVYSDSADSQAYGYMQARVINIDTYDVSTESMYYIFDSDNFQASTIQNPEAVAAVTCEFYLDNTASGFQWAHEKSGGLHVTDDSSVSVRIIVDEVRPIEKMFSKLSEIWGD